MPIAVVTGLAAEARIAQRNGFVAAATAGNPARIATVTRQFLADGASLLVSFGMAGALAPLLVPGTIVLPRRVVGADGTAVSVDAAWHDRIEAALRAAGIEAADGDCLGASAIVMTPPAKAALNARTDAVMVDLESLGVARAAEHGRCPFIVLRAVADPASFALPPAASVGLDRDGRTAFGAVLRSVLRHPGQVPDLIRLGAHARRALAALGPAAAALRRADAARLSPPGGEG